MVLLITSVAGIAFGHVGAGRRRAPVVPTPGACAFADWKLAAVAEGIDRASVGETRVASLLGLEFGMSEEAVAAQQGTLGASWGDLTIAHTFAASDKPGMTVAQMLQLHARGMGWGQVAAALRFQLADAVRAVTAESRVARGRAKPDGKVAWIESGGF